MTRSRHSVAAVGTARLLSLLFAASGLLLTAALRAAEAPTVLPLWPGPAPDESGPIREERTRMSPRLDSKQVEVTEPTRMITDVYTPTLTLRRAPKDKDSGATVVVCPGGGYWNLYWQLEGEEVADWLNSIGVNGILLKYRVPRRAGEPEREPARRPLQDAQRAIRLIRSKAAGWDIDPQRLGIIGFSAGGHLAIAAATSFDKRTYEPVDDIDKLSCRPNFAILVYPGYLKAKDKDELPPGLTIASNTPPVFLAHGGEDLISSPEQSLFMYLALKRAGASAELHIYAATAHDFGVRGADRPYAQWTQSCAAWLKDQGLLKRAAPRTPE
ncbi:MAG: alpha/beta hydrolase [Verrucomicrobia bacterium]|nr:alpha/beta hydrolase [Verrucomicrobiota bacterium]MBI3871372.1 alpha/beta hydrolase [Verrucomicrobiota bacterium]